MVTALIQFNGTLFRRMDREGHTSWDGAKAGYHFITYTGNEGRANFKTSTYPKLGSFYSTRHNNSFKLILIY